MKPNTLTVLFLLIILIAVINPFVSAQIVYTDIKPDVTTSGTYNLDLNNDGTIDFVITHTSKTVNGSKKCKGQTAINQYINITPLDHNEVLDTAANVRKMPANKTIDASASSWKNTSNQLMISSESKCTLFCWWDCYYVMLPTSNGEWYPHAEDGFLGLKIVNGGHSYFGWARLSISDNDSGFTVKDYAFNSTADKAIIAGQKSPAYLGIEPIPNVTQYFCAGNNLTVPYIISGSFSAGNTVTAQLSNKNGSFANPVTIGNVVSNVSGAINAVIPPLTPSGYGYRIRVVSSNPVRTSYSTPFNTSIESGLPAPFIGTNDSINLCQSGSVYLYASYSEGNCYSYQWKLNGNDIPGATSQWYIATAAGKYKCVISSAAGSVISNVISVTANPLPATIKAYPGPIVCGEAVTLSNTGMTGTYQWKLNGSNISGATESSFNPAVSGNYSCRVTNTCGSFTSNTISVSINPPMADATITASGATDICSGLVTLNANTGPGLTYQWYDVSFPYSTYNPRIISGATSSSYAAPVSGVYGVTETNTAGCTRLSNYVVALIGNPQPVIYPSSDSICQDPIDLYLSAEPSIYITPPDVTYSYQWIKDGADIPGATAQNYTAKNPGTYSARLTLNPGGCSGTTAGVVITNCTTGATITNSSRSNKYQSSLFSEPTLNIVPNPVTSTAIISFSLQAAGKNSIKLYDVNGRLIKVLADREFDKGNYQIKLDTKDIHTGIYLLQLKTPGLVRTEKLIVRK